MSLVAQSCPVSGVEDHVEDFNVVVLEIRVVVVRLSGIVVLEKGSSVLLNVEGLEPGNKLALVEEGNRVVLFSKLVPVALSGPPMLFNIREGKPPESELLRDVMSAVDVFGRYAVVGVLLYSDVCSFCRLSRIA